MNDLIDKVVIRTVPVNNPRSVLFYREIFIPTYALWLYSRIFSSDGC